MIWLFAPLSVVLFVVVACGLSDASDGPSDGNDAGPVQTEVAAAMETQTALQKQVDDSVAATVAAQATATTPGSEGSDSGDAEASPEATEDLDPTATPSPTATSEPDPTATPEPPAPTATPVPPAPTATPVPPQPTPTPTEVPPTPTPEEPATIIFERPDSGYAAESGENGIYAKASASFDVAQYPARAFVRSGIYFGLSEDVTSTGVIENSFVPDETGKVRITADAGWNGVLTTKGWGSMASNFEIRLAILGPDGEAIKSPAVGGQASIDSNVASKPVSGNQTLVIEALVEGGQKYMLQVLAECQSSGSSNVWASDTECAFDSASGGYVEWRSLTVEYLP